MNPGPQCRNDFVLQPVGEVRGIQEAERPAIDRVAFLGDLDRLGHQIDLVQPVVMTP